MNLIKMFLGKYENEVKSVLEKYENENVAKRIWEKDHTVWSDSPEEVTNRLDWLISPEETLSKIEEVNAFVEDIKSAGFTHALLLGMGGSSLAPEVFSFSFGTKEGFLNLQVLDSTDPGAVLNFVKNLDPQKTLYIVSTKSGGTIETLSFFKYFFTYCQNKLGKDQASKHFAAITDPGSGLEKMAKELNLRKIFINNPNIGGRYSVLSFFGTVPAALLGIDLTKLLTNAKTIADDSKNPKSVSGEIGVVIGQLAKLGRDKLTFVYSDKIISFGTWVEQLIAESTGKNGVGILPIESENLETQEYYKDDRVFVYTHFENENSLSAKIESLKNAGHPVIEIILNDVFDLGAEFFRWEFATAVSGWVLGIQPFDQPNVESAKIEAKAMINNYLEKGELPKLNFAIEENGIKLSGNTKADNLENAITGFLDNLNEKEKYNYVSIHAYVTPTNTTTEALQNFRTKIQQKYKTAVTIGYGPRFLHSTGQLHKGDSGNGLFIQFTSDRKEDTAIPKSAGVNDSEFSFGVLVNAQLMGDRQALLNNNRKVITIDLGNNVNLNLEKLTSLI
ncbi:MAG: glucose-6-phosphate isomerase [Ignavibacteriae bacterium]|nr:glucose-6-phosphate isomerase [Ignavibacteriota bacterium]MCB9208583.1 glucose-6-phosphate isomerase [Ignavibacteriales bacterium]MCB9258307.1 glucose-6-phosphate isomerase [Ignavibacteriales bacterium]